MREREREREQRERERERVIIHILHSNLYSLLSLKPRGKETPFSFAIYAF